MSPNWPPETETAPSWRGELREPALQRCMPNAELSVSEQ
jgi:hypothetical protein